MSLFDNRENRNVSATCRNAAKAVSGIMEQDGIVNKLRDAVSSSFQKVYSDFNLSMPGMEELHDALYQSVGLAYKDLVGEDNMNQVLQSSNIADQLFQSAARPFEQVSQMTRLMENPIIRQKSEDFFKSLKAEVLHHLNNSEWDVKLKDVLPGDVVEESKTFIHKSMEPLHETMEQAKSGVASFMGGKGDALRLALCSPSFSIEPEMNTLRNKIGSESHKRIAHCHLKMTKAHKALVKDLQKMTGKQMSAFSKLFN